MIVKNKKLIINIAKVLISFILLYFVFQKIPFLEVLILWKKIKIGYFLLAAFLFLTSQLISTKRLEFFLQKNNFHLSFKSNFQLYFIGMLYNFFIPGGIGGDAYKVVILQKQFDWSAKKITSAIFNDRLSGLVAICILIFVFCFYILPTSFYPFVSGGLLLGITGSYFFIRIVFPIYSSIFFRGIFLSIIIQGLQVLSFVFLLKSLGVFQDYFLYAVVFLASSILSLISFSGIGVREMFFVYITKWYNFQPEFAVSASILFTLITAFFSLFGLFFQLKNFTLEESK